MIPKITVFVSTPSTQKQDLIVNKFLELKFAPLVDAQNGKIYSWFDKNVKPVPHKLFTKENNSIYFYDVDDLHPDMNFTPDFMIYYNEDDVIKESDWRNIREWLLYHFFKSEKNMSVDIKNTDEFMLRPITQTTGLDLEKVEKDIKKENDTKKEHYYDFQTYYEEEKDIMLYEVRKPYTDLPYTSVIRNFSKRGHKAFFPSLYICQSWGVSRHDLPFLAFIWKQLKIEEEFNIDLLLKEATEKCYPSKNRIPDTEPEIYRRFINDVLNTLQGQENGVQCGHAVSEIPQKIKNRFL